MKSDEISTLKNSGLKITRIRQDLFNIFKSSNIPLSVSQLLEHIKANKTTIYREISTLTSAGLIKSVDFADGIQRFELAGLDHHHHLICLGCRRIQDVIIDENLDKQAKSISQTQKFRILNHHLEFFGYCQKCL